MLCKLAVRRDVHSESDRTDFVLRVTAAHTLGNARVLGSDEKSFSDQDQVAACLRSLGLSDETIAQFEAVAGQPATATKFVTFSDSEQIAFDRLEDSNFDIFVD